MHREAEATSKSRTGQDQNPGPCCLHPGPSAATHSSLSVALWRRAHAHPRPWAAHRLHIYLAWSLLCFFLNSKQYQHFTMLGNLMFKKSTFLISHPRTRMFGDSGLASWRGVIGAAPGGRACGCPVATVPSTLCYLCTKTVSLLAGLGELRSLQPSAFPAH